MKTILQAAANAEVAAIMHWRSSYLVRLMHTISKSPQPPARRAAIRMFEMETEAILQDVAKGHFHTAGGAKIELQSVQQGCP